MHRTQIYFDELLFESIKRHADAEGTTISAYIRKALKQQVDSLNDNTQQMDLSEFAGLWEDRDISVKDLRNKAWK